MIFKTGDAVRLLYPLRKQFYCGGDNIGTICQMRDNRYLVKLSSGDLVVHDTDRSQDTLLEFMWPVGQKENK